MLQPWMKTHGHLIKFWLISLPKCWSHCFLLQKEKERLKKKQLKYLETKLYIQIYMQILIRCSYDIYKWCKYIYTNLKNEWTKEKYLHSLTCIIYRNMHTRMYLHTHMHTHTRMHIHTHTHTCTYACMLNAPNQPHLYKCEP